MLGNLCYLYKVTALCLLFSRVPLLLTVVLNCFVMIFMVVTSSSTTPIPTLLFVVLRRLEVWILNFRPKVYCMGTSANLYPYVCVLSMIVFCIQLPSAPFLLCSPPPPPLPSSSLLLPPPPLSSFLLLLPPPPSPPSPPPSSSLLLLPPPPYGSSSFLLPTALPPLLSSLISVPTYHYSTHFHILQGSPTHCHLYSCCRSWYNGTVTLT